MKLIFNADDFGYSRAVNFGIVDAHKFGLVTSTTIMTNMPGFDHAVSLSKENPELGIGVHLTLTCGKPLLEDVPSLITESGEFKKLAFYKQPFEVDEDELYREWDAQIKKALDAGILVTHLDSHHHTHTFGMNQKVVVRLAQAYNLPVRRGFSLENQVETTDYFEPEFDYVGSDDGSAAFKEKCDALLRGLMEKINLYDTIEVMCHPAYLDATLYENSSYAIPRLKQITFMTESPFSQFIKSNETIHLCNYSIFKD